MDINKSSKSSIVSSLVEIANDLIFNNLIVINDALYSFIDIEVYYWHKLHPDDYARGVKHSRPLGEFEMHRYGIDLSLGNQENVDFGGILIRGLYDVRNKQVITKPEVVRTLFNQFIQGKNRFELIQKKSGWEGVFRSKRLNLGEISDGKEEYFNSLYKFLAREKELFASYPDKEAIFRDSDLNETEIKGILGYSIKK